MGLIEQHLLPETSLGKFLDDVLMAPFVVMMGSSFALISVTLWNVPKWGVPPYLRNDDGVWRSRMRRWASSDVGEIDFDLPWPFSQVTETFPRVFGEIGFTGEEVREFPGSYFFWGSGEGGWERQSTEVTVEVTDISTNCTGVHIRAEVPRLPFRRGEAADVAEAIAELIRGGVEEDDESSCS